MEIFLNNNIYYNMEKYNNSKGANEKDYKNYYINGRYNWNSFPNEEKTYLTDLLKNGQLSSNKINELFPFLSNTNGILTKIMNYDIGCDNINKQLNKNIGDNEIIVLIPLHGGTIKQSQLGSKTQLIHAVNVDDELYSIKNKDNIKISIIQNSYKMHGYLLDKNGCKSDTINLYINMLIKKIEEYNYNKDIDFFIKGALYYQINSLSSLHLNKCNSLINTPTYKINSELNTILYFFKNNPEVLYKIELEVKQNNKQNNYSLQDIETIIRENIFNGKTYFLTIISLSCRNVENIKKVGHARKLSKNILSIFHNKRLEEKKLSKIKKLARISKINKKLNTIINHDISIFINEIIQVYKTNQINHINNINNINNINI
jgi:hypothetical protein